MGKYQLGDWQYDRVTVFRDGREVCQLHGVDIPVEIFDAIREVEAAEEEKGPDDEAAQ